MKTFFKRYILILIFISSSDSNVFLTRLNLLLNYCINNYDDLKPELLLGVSIANGNLKRMYRVKFNKYFVGIITEFSNSVENIEEIDLYDKIRFKSNFIERKIGSLTNYLREENEIGKFKNFLPIFTN